MRIGDSHPVAADLGQLGGLGKTAASTDLDDSKLDALRRASAKGDAAATSKQFEKLFATLFVRELRRSMPESPFGDGPGADVYEGWFDEQLGDALASRDALGLAGMVKAAIGRAQAARDAANAEASAKGNAGESVGSLP